MVQHFGDPLVAGVPHWLALSQIVVTSSSKHTRDGDANTENDNSSHAARNICREDNGFPFTACCCRFRSILDGDHSVVGTKELRQEHSVEDEGVHHQRQHAPQRKLRRGASAGATAKNNTRRLADNALDSSRAKHSIMHLRVVDGKTTQQMRCFGWYRFCST